MTLVQRRVSLLNVAGLGLISSSAWVLHLAAGLFVAGVSCLALGVMTENPGA